MLSQQSIFLGEHRGNVCIKKVITNHLSPRTHLHLLPSAGILLERLMTMSHFTS